MSRSVVKKALEDEPRSEARPLLPEAFQTIATEARGGLEATLERAKGDHKEREAEREELARALQTALKSSPELKPRVELANQALKQARQRDIDAEATLTANLKFALAELEQLAERHFR